MLADAVDAEAALVEVDHEPRVDTVHVRNVAVVGHRTLEVIERKGCRRARGHFDELAAFADRHDFVDFFLGLQVDDEAVGVADAEQRHVDRARIVDGDPVGAARQQPCREEEAVRAGVIGTGRAAAEILDLDRGAGDGVAVRIQHFAADRGGRFLCVCRNRQYEERARQQSAEAGQDALTEPIAQASGISCHRDPQRLKGRKE